MDPIVSAVNHVRQERDDVARSINVLEHRLQQLDEALTALNALVKTSDSESIADPGRETRETAIPATYGGGGSMVPVNATSKTTKDHVMDALLEENRPFSMDDLAYAVKRNGAQGDRTDKQLRGTIRTALWTLRKEKKVASAGHGQNIAAHWLPDDYEFPESTDSDSRMTGEDIEEMLS